MAKREMMNQMSDQMDIPKRKARNLMKKANTMNDMEMAMGGLNEGGRNISNSDRARVSELKNSLNLNDGGMAMKTRVF